MVKFILTVNPRAGFESVVFDKINEVFGNPFMSQIEQLSDFYLVLDFTEENVKKVASFQDFDGIINLQLTPTEVVKSEQVKAVDKEDYYIIFVQTECGKHEQTMQNLLACDKVKVRNAGYFFDNRADIILEVLSADGATKLINDIREIEGVEDTILYTLPHTYE